MTLSGLANHASESRSNEDPLPDTEDGEKDGDDARGESNVKSSSCSSLATLGLSVEWEVSLATLRGPRGESPGSSFETSSGGGAGRVIRCGNGLARTDPARSDRQRDGDLSGKSRGHRAGTRGRGRGPSRSSVEDEALSRAGLNGDARRGDHGEHQRGACPATHPIDANLDSDDINHRHPNAECPTERPCPPTLAHPPLHLPNPHFLRLRWCGYVA